MKKVLCLLVLACVAVSISAQAAPAPVAPKVGGCVFQQICDGSGRCASCMTCCYGPNQNICNTTCS